ncbi:MAG: hypothetical protein ABJM58_08310 [Alteripontixanthobacter sp.]
MYSDVPKRSKLAIGFYVLGSLWLLANLLTLFTSGGKVLALGLAFGAGGALGTILISLLAQPILIMLFGGVVQVLVDIKDALTSEIEDFDA